MFFNSELIWDRLCKNTHKMVITTTKNRCLYRLYACHSDKRSDIHMIVTATKKVEHVYVVVTTIITQRMSVFCQFVRISFLASNVGICSETR